MVAAPAATAMFKTAYFSFIAALAATPVHFAAGDAQTGAAVLALLLLSGVFAGLGFSAARRA